MSRTFVLIQKKLSKYFKKRRKEQKKNIIDNTHPVYIFLTSEFTEDKY